MAVGQTLADTGLRLSLSPPKLRNLQAVISIISLLPLLLAISMAVRDTVFVFGWAAALPDWIIWLPTGLAVRALATTDGGSAALWCAVMVGEVFVIGAIGYALLQRQLRDGVVAAGSREAARRGRRADRSAAVVAATRTMLAPVQRRELQLLGRDRSFLVQTLLLPSITVGAQVVINARSNVFAGAIDHPAGLAAIAFALAAYTLALSAFQTLNAEGQALWILYCVPRPLESVLRDKAKLWAAAAMIHPMAVFAVAVALAGHI